MSKGKRAVAANGPADSKQRSGKKRPPAAAQAVVQEYLPQGYNVSYTAIVLTVGAFCFCLSAEVCIASILFVLSSDHLWSYTWVDYRMSGLLLCCYIFCSVCQVASV